jgi:superfamily II DNA or RNA helicase
MIDAWAAYAAGSRFLLLVMPTGAGKTVVMGEIFRRHGYVPMVAIAHRQELVLQMSMALARHGIYHRILAPEETIRFVVDVHLERLGASFVDHRSPIAVGGVDTIIRRDYPNPDQVVLWLTDEAHHLLVDNKWGRAIRLFTNARGAGLTASPWRLDKRPLGIEKGGIFDAMVVGPTGRELVEQGHIVPVEFFGPPPAMNRDELEISQGTKDFSLPKMRAAAKRSRIVGDLVQTYLRIAPGERALTFAVDVDLAEQHVAAFKAVGIPSAMVTDRTKVDARRVLFRRFEAGEILQLVNVNIAGEGTDLPAVSVVCDASPTQSYSLWLQRVGRVRRTAPGKTHGKVIDHAGNFVAMITKYGHPDDMVWDELDADLGERRRTGPRGDPVRTCVREGCWRSFMSWSTTCPHCGHTPATYPARRPEEVEGDLLHYGPELMAELQARAADAVRLPNGRAPTNARQYMTTKHMEERAMAQRELRDLMEWWSGIRGRYFGEEISARYRRFYGTFGVDVATAQTLPGPEARRLTALIRKDLGL